MKNINNTNAIPFTQDLHDLGFHEKVIAWAESAFTEETFNTTLLEILPHIDKIDRTVTKISVMVCLSYNASMLTSFTDIKLQLELKGVVLSTLGLKFIQRHLFYSMETAFPAAVQYSKWSGKLSREVTKRDGVFSFTSPQTKFPVFLQARKTEEMKVSYYDIGTRKKREAVIRKTLKETDVRKTAAGAIPGKIHSMDSGILIKTAEAFYNRGLAFAGIHDSFNVHCNNVFLLIDDANKVMHDLADGDVLMDIAKECSQGDVGFVERHKPPHQGTLDIGLIKIAKHAFS